MPQAIEWSLATPKISASRPDVQHPHCAVGRPRDRRAPPLTPIATPRSRARRAPPFAVPRDEPVRPPSTAVAGRPRTRARCDPSTRPMPCAGSAACCWTSTASLVMRGARRCRARSRQSRRSTAAGIPYRVVTNTSAHQPGTLAAAGRRGGLHDPTEPDHDRPLGDRRLDARRLSRPTRCSCWPPPTARASSAASHSCSRDEAVARRRPGCGRRHRRRRGGHPLRRPQRRVPPRARRRAAPRDAPQSVVAARPDGADDRLRRVGGRPRVRDGRRVRP